MNGFCACIGDAQGKKKNETATSKTGDQTILQATGSHNLKVSKHGDHIRGASHSICERQAMLGTGGAGCLTLQQFHVLLCCGKYLLSYSAPSTQPVTRIADRSKYSEIIHSPNEVNTIKKRSKEDVKSGVSPGLPSHKISFSKTHHF